jgi:hypothetical protein
MRTIDWGYATVSGTYLRHYSAPSCSTCRSLADGMDTARKAGHRYIGGRITVLSARPGAAGALHSVIVKVNGTSFEEVDEHGKYVSADEAHIGLQFEITLHWAADMWDVTALAVVQ